MLKEINDKDFATSTEKGLVVVDFWAPWCGPCKAIAPILEDLQKEMPDVTILKMNVDENPDTAMKFNVRSIPTLVIFSEGVEVNRTVGSGPKEHYKKIIEGAKK